MRVFLCLVGLLCALPLEGQAQLEPAEIEAGRRAEARDMYLDLFDRFPENDDYLVWAGRISRWLGDADTAVEYLDQVLGRAPNHSDALLEKAYVRMSQQRYGEAQTLLAMVSAEAATSPDVQLARARLLSYQDQPAEARTYVARVLENHPDSQEALDLDRQLAGRLVGSPKMEVVLGYGHDRFSFAGPAHFGGLTVSYTGAETRLGIHSETWDKFGNQSQRVGPRVTQRVGERLWLRGSALWARDAQVLARQDYSGGISYALPGGLVPGLDYRQLRFEDPLVHVVSPSVEYYLEQPIWIRVAFHGSWSRYRTSPTPNTNDQSVSFQYNQQLGSMFLARLGYARGNESFSDLSLDRVGDFDANTYSAGADIAFSGSLTARFFYSHQDRSTGADQNSVGVNLVIRK